MYIQIDRQVYEMKMLDLQTVQQEITSPGSAVKQYIETDRILRVDLVGEHFLETSGIRHICKPGGCILAYLTDVQISPNRTCLEFRAVTEAKKQHDVETLKHGAPTRDWLPPQLEDPVGELKRMRHGLSD